jgi:hypothetical protein
VDDLERQHALAGPSENGRRSLVGVTYSDRRFERLLFGPGDPFSGGVEVESCKFISCSTESTFSITHGVRMCNDPLKTCSGVNFPEGDTDERNDGRRDQALDRPTQVGAGP